jgi:hypothetical protein
MSQISLTVVPCVGSNITQVAKESILLSKKLKINIHFKFNVVTVIVGDTGDADFVHKEYMKVMKSKEINKIVFSL